MAIGSASPYEGEQQAEIRGREVATGRPKTVMLTPMEVRDALEDNVANIVETAAECLGEAAPELAQDIMFEGIHLTGGGALLRGMTQRLAERDRGAGAPGGHAARVRGAGRGDLPAVLRPAEAAVHPGRLSGPRRRAGRRPRVAVGRVVEQLLGRLAHLPVTVGRRPAQGRFDARVVEAGQRDGGAPAHRGPVLERGEHGVEPRRVADGAERGDRRLAAAGVVVPGRQRDERRGRRVDAGARRRTRRRRRPRADRGRPGPR